MRQLLISDGWTWERSSDGTPLLPAAVAETIIGSQCSSLWALCIMAEDVGLRGSDMTVLAALTRLRCLKVRKHLQSPAGTHAHTRVRVLLGSLGEGGRKAMNPLHVRCVVCVSWPLLHHICCSSVQAIEDEL